MSIRTLLLSIVSLVLAGAAGAATLEISGPTMVSLGETFELTFTADSEGETNPTNGIYVGISYDQALLEAHSGPNEGTFTQFDGGVPTTLGGSQAQCDYAVHAIGECLVLQQLIDADGFPVDAGPLAVTISFTWIGGPGTAVFDYVDLVGSDFVFFSLGDETDVGTAPSGWSVTAIPEPGTAALLALGLLGLGASRRRGAARR